MNDSFHQLYMNRAYAGWVQNDDLDRDEFWDSLNLYEAIAVYTGNLNYQVENGGFLQWHDNGYSDAYTRRRAYSLDYVFDCLDHYESVRTVQSIVQQAMNILREMDDYDEFDDELREEHLEQLDVLDQQYYNVNEQFMQDIESVLSTKNSS